MHARVRSAAVLGVEAYLVASLLPSPDVFARSINDGRERWGKIIRAAGLKGK